MTRFEYLAIFYGVVFGLALGNVATSFHKLLEAGRRVRWHWMAPLNAAGVTLGAFGQYWIWWVTRDAGLNNPTFLTYLPGTLASLVMFMACAASLPDEVPEAGIDLREFYFSSHRRFWSLVLVMLLLRLFQNVLFSALFGFEENITGLPMPLMISMAALLPIVSSLIYFRTPWWHGTWICLLFVGTLFSINSLKI